MAAQTVETGLRRASLPCFHDKDEIRCSAMAALLEGGSLRVGCARVGMDGRGGSGGCALGFPPANMDGWMDRSAASHVASKWPAKKEGLQSIRPHFHGDLSSLQ